MNIFYTDPNPEIAARSLCNRHVVKMGMESVQILGTVFPQHATTIKHTHFNHPCSIWVRKSPENFAWLLKHATAIFYEYECRYGRIHQWDRKLFELESLFNQISNISRYFPQLDFIEPPKCMPEEFKVESVCQSYRNYYIGDKSRFAKWMSIDQIPNWWPEKSDKYLKL